MMRQIIVADLGIVGLVLTLEAEMLELPRSDDSRPGEARLLEGRRGEVRAMGLANPALLQVPLGRRPEIPRHLDQGTRRPKRLVQLREQPDHLVGGDPRIQSGRERRGQPLPSRWRIELKRQLAAREDHSRAQHRGGETAARRAGGRQAETGQHGEKTGTRNPARGGPRDPRRTPRASAASPNAIGAIRKDASAPVPSATTVIHRAAIPRNEATRPAFTVLCLHLRVG